MREPTVIPSSIQSAPLLGDWIRVCEDGSFDVRSGKVELGQGISAALVKIACDGLGVMPQQVRLLAGDTQHCPDEGYTAGSQSIEVGGVALAWACERLRQLFGAEAAQRLGVAADQLRVSRGVFALAGGDSGISYHTLAGQLDYQHQRIDNAWPVDKVHAPAVASEADVTRADLRQKMTGAGFVHDLALPGMLHARVLRGPHPASRPVQVDADRLRALDGVEHLVRSGDFLALAGRDEAKIAQAAENARQFMQWALPQLPAFEETDKLLPGLPSQTQQVVSTGVPRPSVQRLSQRYSRPYLAHAAIGASCAVAAPSSGPGQDGIELTVWSHTQGAFKLRDQMAQALGLPAQTVRVIHSAGSGCYGHNGADDVAFDAAYLAQVLKAPVRVQWTREDEMTVAPMGSASLVQLDAGLDAHGMISDWQAQVWSHSHVARPGWGEGINLLGAWACDPPAVPAPAQDMALPAGGGLRNIVPYYALPALTVRHHFIAEAPVRVSALRSLGAHANVFAIESFMDELAALAHIDPVEFRLRHLQEARARGVVETAARMAGWAQRHASGEGQGLGFGFGRYKNRSGYCAVAMAVRVEEAVKVERVWAAVDVGAVVHRDGLLNQIEGGIIQALSWSLKEAVRWSSLGISTASWDAYPILNFDEVPEVSIELIDHPAEPSLGSGELAAGPVAAALGNAVAHALGVRARHLPLSPERLLQLVHSDAGDAAA